MPVFVTVTLLLTILSTILTIFVAFGHPRHAVRYSAYVVTGLPSLTLALLVVGGWFVWWSHMLSPLLHHPYYLLRPTRWTTTTAIEVEMPAAAIAIGVENPAATAIGAEIPTATTTIGAEIPVAAVACCPIFGICGHRITEFNPSALGGGRLFRSA
ncbi:hypothetical protein NL676_030537 [Syzygium grande]|nr:hypothetical protein NL676_030537 [Syzygium grande]